MQKSVKKKLIKEKKPKSFYAKWVNPMLLLYGLTVVVLGAIVMIVTLSVPFEKAELAAIISGIIAIVLFIAISLSVVFYFTPLLKKSQAKRDFALCDFTPYISRDESEIFTCEYHMCRYTMSASPFDSEVSLTFENNKETEEYISQHFAQTLISTQLYYNGMNKSPFFIHYYFEGDDGVTMRVDKKTDGKISTLDIYEIHTAEFTADGLKLGKKLIPYNLMDSDVKTGFSKDTDFYAAIRLFINHEDGFLSFQFSSRIVEIIKRFNIKVWNKDVFDYVLDNPARAFEQTALQSGLKKLK